MREHGRSFLFCASDIIFRGISLWSFFDIYLGGARVALGYHRHSLWCLCIFFFMCVGILIDPFLVPGVVGVKKA
jgi:hypothetical protein